MQMICTKPDAARLFVLCVGLFPRPLPPIKSNDMHGTRPFSALPAFFTRFQGGEGWGEEKRKGIQSPKHKGCEPGILFTREDIQQQ